jgi:hypothetical protein
MMMHRLAQEQGEKFWTEELKPSSPISRERTLPLSHDLTSAPTSTLDRQEKAEALRRVIENANEALIKLESDNG